MRILQWNMNGLLNNYPDLNILINEFSPDIISIQETHIPFNKKLHAPNKYDSYFYNSTQNTSCKQGIAVFIRKSLNHKEIPVSSNISCLAIEVDIGFKITIINCYIPPHQILSVRDISDVLNYFATPIIIMGDLNAWSPLWGSTATNKRGEIIEDIILSHDLIVLNDGSPTHFSTHGTFTHPDVILASATLAPKLTSLTLDDLHNSDHFPIITSLSTPKSYNVKPRSKFLTEKADWPTFCSLAISLSNNKPPCPNINAETTAIKSIIRSAAHLTIPQSSTKKFTAKLPYWSNLLAILRNNKKRLWTKFKRNRTDNNLIEYKKANAVFRKELKSAKRISLENITSNINPSSSPKQIWSDIKALTGCNKRFGLSHIHTDQGPLYSPQDIAEKFAQTWSSLSENSFFHTSFNSLKNQVFSEPYNNPSPSPKALSIEADITINEYDITISALAGKTPGADKISYPILKNIPNPIKSRLVNLYNKILNSGIYPQQWKIATIIPVPKPNKPTSHIENYRPISLLPCMSKVLEKIISTRIMWYARANELISPNQFGFQKGLGVIDPLLFFEHFASTALATRNHVSILSLDFEKAFDRVGAHIVLNELKRWKIGTKIYNIVKSFLCNRKFIVCANRHQSLIYNLYNGIPQGSPLSVTLFIIAFNKVSSIISSNPRVEHFAYADDVVIFTKIKDLQQVEHIFLKILNDINKWSERSGANISASKSSSFHICRKHNCSFPSLHMFNTQIPHTNTLKILGLIFDKTLSYKEHCKSVRLSLLSRLNIIKFLSSKYSLCHSNTIANVTKALLLSKIDHGLSIYGHCAKTHIKLILPPYHAAARRSIRAFPTSPIKAILPEAGLPNIVQRTARNTMVLIPKLFQARNVLLLRQVRTALKHTNVSCKPSTISRCLSIAKQLNIVATPTLVETAISPPYSSLTTSLITTSQQHRKQSTSNNEYQQLHNRALEHYNKTWEVVYTDGSKSDTGTAFAVTNKLGSTIAVYSLPPYCSVFTAEAAAILEAVLFASRNGKKTVICTDSKSAIDAIFNQSNCIPMIQKIRNIIMQHSNAIKIMWVPAHIGIRGNETADRRAKAACCEPLYISEHFTDKDIRKLVKQSISITFSSEWRDYKHHYKDCNPTGSKPYYGTSCPTRNIATFTRLRIGHTLATHAHLLNGTTKPNCPHCGSSDFNVMHILDNCPDLQQIRLSLFNNTKPSDYLKATNDRSINLIAKFVALSKLNI
uniref:Putative RNA-directed DNA polymerase from transposon X-element n=1 Tax=Bactrocera latifrons TaxID=174628 RepID=A0A0K8VY27_BACLA